MKRIIFTLGFALVGSCLNDNGNLGADRRDGTGASGGSSGTGSTGNGGTSGSSPDAAGGGAGTAGTAGSAGNPDSGNGGAPCNPEGTWSVSYEGECFNGRDLVFVARTGPKPTDLRVRFADRPPLPAGCAETDEPVYSTAVQFIPETCSLKFAYNASLCASGELRCLLPQGELIQVGVQIDLRNPSIFSDGAGTMVCPPPPQTRPLESACSARVTRLAGPSDCPGPVMGNTPCATSAVCDSGCGTPCRCENGRWQCEYPLVGQACWENEACAYRVDVEAGGQEGLACGTVPGGQPMFMPFETRSLPSVCPADPPPSTSPCNLYPRGLACDYPGRTPSYCVCEARDAVVDEWRCSN